MLPPELHTGIPVSRRDAVATLVAGAAGLAGCSAVSEGPVAGGGSSRVTARPTGLGSGTATGSIRLDFGTARDGYLFVPSQGANHAALPLVLALHGAGGNAAAHMAVLAHHAQRVGFFLLGVDSRGTTWDGIYGRFGPDVAFIDRALNFAFSRYAVDPAGTVVSGFSDGASYALALGLTNSTLFQKIIAFSPGYIPSSDTPQTGTPDVFLSHGQQDSVLDIDRGGRAIASFLRAGAHDVTLREFTGGHTVPDEIASAAADWVVA